jgi:putative transposase
MVASREDSYLLRDRDKIYGRDFRQRIPSLRMEEVLSAPARPRQRAYVQRLIGSIRRDCLDHVIVLGEWHLRTIITSYLEYYDCSRTHFALVKNTPEPRAIEPPELGESVELP